MRIYLSAIIIAIFSQSINAQICVPSKFDQQAKTVCGLIQNFNMEEMVKSKFVSEYMVYDDCGLVSLIVYDAKSPYTIFKYPMKPFFEGITNLNVQPLAQIENPFASIAESQKLGETQIKADAKFLVGRLMFQRTIMGRVCEMKDKSRVVVAGSNIRNKVQTLGSHIISPDYSILASNGITELSTNYAEMTEAQKDQNINKVAQQIVTQSYEKTANILEIDKKNIKEVLDVRIKSIQFKIEINEAIKKLFVKDKYSVAGVIISDLEKTIGASPSLRTIWDQKFTDKMERIRVNMDGIKDKINLSSENEKLKEELTRLKKALEKAESEQKIKADMSQSNEKAFDVKRFFQNNKNQIFLVVAILAFFFIFFKMR